MLTLELVQLWSAHPRVQMHSGVSPTKESRAPGFICLDQNMQIAVKPNGEH